MRLPTLALAVAALGLAVPQLADARAALVSSSPAVNASVAKTGRIDLVFNERIRPANTRIQLFMTAMPGMANHAPMAMPVSIMMGKDGKSVMVMSRAALSGGAYELRWTAAGDDKQVISGKFSFQVR